LKCEQKRAYLSAEHAGRVAASRQREGAPTLYPYECPECGCFHLSKMDRDVALMLNRKAPAVEAKPSPSPLPAAPATDPRIKEATELLKMKRGNFVESTGNVETWLLRLSSGEIVCALANGGRKVKQLNVPDDDVRRMYPALFATT